jgi:hypothetical protein
MLRRIFNGVVFNPGVLFSAGNLVLASSVAGTEGVVVSASALALTTALQCYKAITGRTGFNSLYLTAAANFITAASTLYNSAILGGELLKGISAATAFGMWGGAHIFLAKRDANEGQHGKVLTNPFLYGFLGNVASLQVYGLRLLPSLCVAAAMGRSVMKLDGPSDKPDTMKALFNKHVTPVKFTALGFVAGAIQSALTQDYTYMASQLVWGFAALNLDQAYNEKLPEDIRQVRTLKAEDNKPAL